MREKKIFIEKINVSVYKYVEHRPRPDDMVYLI